MTNKERLLRAKRLIEQGAPAGLREAEQFLKSLNLDLNPATQIINREMSPFEAVMYLDTVLQSKSYKNIARKKRSTNTKS